MLKPANGPVAQHFVCLTFRTGLLETEILATKPPKMGRCCVERRAFEAPPDIAYYSVFLVRYAVPAALLRGGGLLSFSQCLDREGAAA
jgi:hypothetical protein